MTIDNLNSNIKEQVNDLKRGGKGVIRKRITY